MIAYIRDTIHAYEAWCGEHGRAPRVVTADISDLVERPEATLAAMVDEALAGPDAPDAIFAPIELVGVAIHATLLARGLAVPDDLMLVTTHDAGTAAAAHITTLEWNHRDMGRQAADLLLDLIDGRRGPPCEEIVTCQVVAAGHDPAVEPSHEPPRAIKFRCPRRRYRRRDGDGTGRRSGTGAGGAVATRDAPWGRGERCAARRGTIPAPDAPGGCRRGRLRLLGPRSPPAAPGHVRPDAVAPSDR